MALFYQFSSVFAENYFKDNLHYKMDFQQMLKSNEGY